MKTIVITGPSGSGKTFLSNKLSISFPGTILIKTDSYYKDCKFIKFLSTLVSDIYDRPMSIKRKAIIDNIISINDKSKFINSYYYDFRRRISLNKKIKLNYQYKEQFLIIEGIFAHRLDIDYFKTINIICEEDKLICFKRRLKRDKIERGRSVNEVEERFEKSWCLFHQNVNDYINKYETITVNPLKKNSYNKLVSNLSKYKKN